MRRKDNYFLLKDSKEIDSDSIIKIFYLVMEFDYK